MIYDCFTFFNELEILDLRLNILYEHVDKFVIVEANITHTGAPKEFLFEKNIDKFQKFMDKIIYIKLDDCPDLESSEAGTDNNKWIIENYQRDAITRGLVNCSKDDIVIISDLDEIPNPKAIKKYKKGICSLLQIQFLYNYNTIRSLDSLYAKSPKICHYSDLVDPKQQIKNKDKNYCQYSEYGNPTYLRFCRGKRLKDGGWHFSYIGDTKRMVYKAKSVTEKQFLNTLDPENLEKNIEEVKLNFQNNTINLKLTNVYPKYFLENVEKYSDFICKNNQKPFELVCVIYHILRFLKVFHIRLR